MAFRIDHVSRRRIERPIKKSILPPIEFLGLENVLIVLKESMLEK